jgi:hypothetical protein
MQGNTPVNEKRLAVVATKRFMSMFLPILMLSLKSFNLSAFGVEIAVYMIASPWNLSFDQVVVLKSLPLLACYAQDSRGNGFGKLVFRDT